MQSNSIPSQKIVITGPDNKPIHILSAEDTDFIRWAEEANLPLVPKSLKDHILWEPEHNVMIQTTNRNWKRPLSKAEWKLQHLFDKFYFAPEHNIIACNPEGIYSIRRLIQELGEKSPLCRHVQREVEKAVRTNHLFFVLWPGKNVFSLGGEILDGAVIYNGNRNNLICLPQNRPWFVKKNTLAHEVGHFYMTAISPFGSPSPIEYAPHNLSRKFMNAYWDIKKAIENERLIPATPIQKLIFHNIFERPTLLYPSVSVASEIAAHTLQFELNYPGLLSRNCPKEYLEAFDEIVFQNRKLPFSLANPHKYTQLPAPTTRNLPACASHFESVSLSKLNGQLPDSALHQTLRVVGNGVFKALKGLEHICPGHTIPLAIEVFFQYDKRNEQALCTALNDGVACWGIGLGIGAAASAVSGPFALTLSIGSIGAEFAPDLQMMSRTLPQPGEISQFCKEQGLTRFGEAALQQQVERDRAVLWVTGCLQKGLKALNPSRIWHSVKRKAAEQSLKNPGKIEEAAALDISAHLSQYLEPPKIPQVLPAKETQTISSILEDIEECRLPWTVSQSASGEFTATTEFKLEENDLDAIAELAATLPEEEEKEGGTPAPNLTIFKDGPLEKEDKQPKISELFKISKLEFSPGILGEAAVSGTLGSGAKVSVGMTSSQECVVCLTVPLGKMLLPALGTGFVCAAGVAAVVIATAYLIKQHKQDIKLRLQKNHNCLASELNDAKQLKKNFKEIVDKLIKGEIDQESFTRKTNAIVQTLHKSATDAVALGNSSFKNKGASFDFFSSSTKLHQLATDISIMGVKAKLAVGSSSDLKNMSFEELLAEQKTLAGSQILSFQASLRQEALKKEIESRKGLSQVKIEELAVIPAGIHIEAKPCERPKNLKHGQMNFRKNSAKRKESRIRRWADATDAAYQNFLNLVNGGASPQEITEAGEKVLRQVGIDSIFKDGNSFFKIGIKDSKEKFITAHDYYKEWITGIKGNVDSALNKVRAFETGSSDRNLFTQEEIERMKYLSLVHNFADASKKFEEAENDRDKNAAFEEMRKNGEALKALMAALGMEDPDDVLKKGLDAVSDIISTYGSYSNYVNTRNSKKYQKHLTTIYTPIKRLLLYAWRPQNKTGQKVKKVIREVNSFAPFAVSSVLTVPHAVFNGEGAASIKLIENEMLKSMVHLYKPFETFRKVNSLHKASFYVQKWSVVTGIFETTVRSLPKSYRNKTLKKSAASLNSAVSNTSSAAYYAHLGNKIQKYTRLGVMSAKLSKISSDLFNLAVEAAGLYEFMAKELNLPNDRNKWGISDHMKKYLKDKLPNFDGRLPESENYYYFKSATQALGSSLLALVVQTPLTLGAAAYTNGKLLIDTWNEKFKDDHLAAIMLNIAYNEKMGNTSLIKESVKNLSDSVGFKRVAPNDSLIRKKAKILDFTIFLKDLEKQQHYSLLDMCSSLDFSGQKCYFNYTGVDIFDHFDCYVIRCNSAINYIQKGKDPAESFKTIFKFLREISQVKQIHQRELSHVDEKRKSAFVEYGGILNTFEQSFISLYSLNYLTNGFGYPENPLDAIEIFDRLPKENRELLHWCMFAKALQELNEKKYDTDVLANLMQTGYKKILDLIGEKKTPLLKFEELLQQAAEKFLSELKYYEIPFRDYTGVKCFYQLIRDCEN